MKKKISLLMIVILSYLIGYHLIYSYAILKLNHLANNFISPYFFSTENYSTFRDRLIFSIAFSFFVIIFFNMMENFKQRIAIILFVFLVYILRFGYLMFSFNDINNVSFTTNSFGTGTIMLISVILLTIFIYFKNRREIVNE